jgi:hypothetical protein
MPSSALSFSNEIPDATTIGHDDDDSLGSDEGSEASDQGSKVSASEYDGDLADMPSKILFTELECRRRVTNYKNDPEDLIRVCGNRFGSCSRSHVGATRYGAGVYQTVAGRNRFVDGQGGTCISNEEYQEMLRVENLVRNQDMAAAGRALGARNTPDAKGTKGRMLDTPPSVVRGRMGGKDENRTGGFIKGRFKTPPPKVDPKASVSAAKGGGTVAAASFLKPAPPGVRKGGPGGAAIKPAAAIEPDPMLETMQNLAMTLGSLSTQMKDMQTEIKNLKAAPPPKVYPPAETEYAEPPPSVATGPFYAIAYGRDGHQGVYGSWSECAGLVTGVPGNVFQKFSTLEAATEFVRRYNVGRSERQTENPGGNLFRDGPEGIGGNLVNSSGPYAQGEAAFEKFLGTQENDGEVHPPLSFFGPDPSIKKEDEFYGFDLTTEWDVGKILLPPGLEVGLGKGVTQAITDVVSLPGGYQSNVGNDEEGLALFTQSMAEMAHGNKSEMELFGRPDFNWRSGGRTSLRAVTSQKKLQARLKILVKVGQRVRRQTIKLVSNGLKRSGWKDEQKIVSWAQGGPIYRLVSDTLDYNLFLHQYLLGLTNSKVSWDFINTEIQHHVEELVMIRSTADSRIQALLLIYCYLRDGHAAGWQSTSLQTQRNMEMFAMRHGDSDSDDNTGTPEVATGNREMCPKCATTLHSGGSRACPWSNMSNKKAKLAGAQALRVNGLIPPTAGDG